MTMVGRVAMGRWFNHRRGMATAISGIPVAFAFNATPWILNKLINTVRLATGLLANGGSLSAAAWH